MVYLTAITILSSASTRKGSLKGRLLKHTTISSVKTHASRGLQQARGRKEFLEGKGRGRNFLNEKNRGAGSVVSVTSLRLELAS